MKISDKFHSEDIYKLKNTVLTGKTEDIKWRLKNINIVSKLLDENKKEIIKSLFVDLGKSDIEGLSDCLLYTSPSPRDLSTSRMPSSA